MQYISLVSYGIYILKIYETIQRKLVGLAEVCEAPFKSLPFDIKRFSLFLSISTM